MAQKKERPTVDEIMNDRSTLLQTKAAIAAHKKGQLKAWVEKFLEAEHNHGLANAIKNTPLKALEFVRFPLEKLNKIQGPEAIPDRESLNTWESRVQEQITEIKNGRLPAPLIVTDFWWPLEIADGNHRHEALVREGFKKYWTIFFVKDEKNLQLIKSHSSA